MNVDVAHIDDFAAWLHLAAEVEPLFGPLVGDPRFEEALRRNIERGTAYCVREDDGPPGMPLLGGLLFSPRPPRYTIGWLAVAGGWRRRGVGRALVERVVALVQPPAEMIVTTFGPDDRTGMAARVFYEQMGFEPAGMAPEGPNGSPRQYFRRVISEGAKDVSLKTGSLAAITQIDIDIESYLDQLGEVFRVFRDQDSGCTSYGLLVAGRRWFVKHSDEPRGLASLRRAQDLHSTVRHEALPSLHNAFQTLGGLALVFDWVPGELLYDYTRFRGEAGRRDPVSPHSRFRALPVARILDALDTIYDVHLLLADHGFVAVDFYDGCILYDFDRARTYLCDLDEYRPGPFWLSEDRLPGSGRFMAPEEWRRGARIDQVTNVFTLGRTALELLGDGTFSADTWRGSQIMREVVMRATSVERGERHQSVREFVRDWRSATRSLLDSDRFRAQAAKEVEQRE